MANLWVKSPIHKHCEITSSKRIFAADYLSEGVPFYRGKEITEKHKGSLNVSTEIFISKSKFLEIKNKFGAPKPGDLLLTSVGTLGMPYVVKQGEEFYFKDGNLTWFRNFKDLDSRFIYYWLLSPQGKGELKKATIGSSQSAYTIVLLKEMEVALPPLETQHKIASILSAYDDLIENNTRRIKNLEEMARMIYREWFVNFRFPGHEQVRMVDVPVETHCNASLQRMPEGWEVRTLKDFGTIVTGKTPSTRVSENFGSFMPFIKTPDMHGNLFCIEAGEALSELGAASQKNKTIPPDSLCVSCIGTAGIVTITSAYAQTNQQINSIVLNDVTVREFLYFALLDLRKVINQYGANGATMVNLNKGKFEALEVICPDADTMKTFQKHVFSHFEEIKVLQKKNQNLRQTRDLLLPKLISGEVAVSEMGNFV